MCSEASSRPCLHSAFKLFYSFTWIGFGFIWDWPLVRLSLQFLVHFGCICCARRRVLATLRILRDSAFVFGVSCDGFVLFLKLSDVQRVHRLRFWPVSVQFRVACGFGFARVAFGVLPIGRRSC